MRCAMRTKPRFCRSSSAIVVARDWLPQALVARSLPKCGTRSFGWVGPSSRIFASSSVSSGVRSVCPEGGAGSRGRGARSRRRTARPLHAERLVAAFEVAGAVALHPVAQDEVLGAGRRAYRVGLHEAEALERALKRGRWEEGLGDGETAQSLHRGRRLHATAFLRAVAIDSLLAYSARTQISTLSSDAE